MAAFERALEEGADGIELDVRRCGSGELVVAHDPDLRRLSGGVDLRSVHLLPYRELARLDLGQGQRIPRLSEVLAWARGRRLLLNVELKGDAGDPLGLARDAWRALAGVPQVERYALFSSFHPQILGALRLLGCPLPLAFLFHEGQRSWHPWGVGRVVGVRALHPERTMSFPGAIQRARSSGFLVNVWTVNDEQEAADLTRLGVDGLITDHPAHIGAAARGAAR